MSDLARKLDIVPGQTICLLAAPPASAALLRESCPPGVRLQSDEGEEQSDRVFFWPVALVGLAERFSALQHAIVPDGAIWVVMPNKRSAPARGITFTWEQVQAAALTTDLVDNKIVSLSSEEYATRFVIRKERRAAYR